MALNKAQLMDVPGGPGVTGSVKQGTGITIGGDGTISLTAVGGSLTPGSYTNTNLTVDQYGRITAAANGGGSSGGVTSLTSSNKGITLSPTTITSTGSIGFTSGSAVCYPSQRQVNNTTVVTGGPLGQEAQTKSFGTLTFTYPAGATSAILWQRMFCLSTANTSGSTGGYVAGEGLTYDVTVSGSASFNQGGTNVESSNLGAIAEATLKSRNQGQFLMRVDLLNLTSSSGGSFTLSATVGQDSSTQADNQFKNWQVSFQPFAPI